jgi:hypothetical protein
MINAVELRLGSYVLHKSSGRISMVAVHYSHFEALSKGDAANFFPVVLKPELLQKCGFIENKDYPLLPQAREFKLVLPVQGSQQNEIIGYVKSNGECFVRAVVNNIVISQNLFNLHSLQNLFFVLTGKEIELKK